MDGIARGYVDLRRLHFKARFAQSLGGRLGVLRPHVGQQYQLSNAHAPGDSLADRTRSDYYNNFAHGLSPCIVKCPADVRSSQIFRSRTKAAAFVVADAWSQPSPKADQTRELPAGMWTAQLPTRCPHYSQACASWWD